MDAPNAGIGFGVFLAIVGLLLLCFRIFWDFRYRLLGRLLHAENCQVYPSKEHTAFFAVMRYSNNKERTNFLNVEGSLN